MASSSWLLALSFVAVESDPPKVQGATKIEPRRSQQSIPEGANIYSWRPPWGSLGPGRSQVPAKAALRPPLGGSWGALSSSWGRLGAPLAPLGTLVSLPEGSSPEAPGGAPGGHFARYLSSGRREARKPCFSSPRGKVLLFFRASSSSSSSPPSPSSPTLFCFPSAHIVHIYGSRERRAAIASVNNSSPNRCTFIRGHCCFVQIHLVLLLDSRLEFWYR